MTGLETFVCALIMKGATMRPTVKCKCRFETAVHWTMQATRVRDPKVSMDAMRATCGKHIERAKGKVAL